MAKYEIAESITGLNEGGYANDSKDYGKETYGGISRRFWPNSEIWAYVDAAKKRIGYDGHLNPSNIIKAQMNTALKTPEVKKLLSIFYKRNFWNINCLDIINDQQIANTIYDFSVNKGEDYAASMMQESVNEILGFKKLSVDGDLGTKSITEINKINAGLLYQLYNKKREAYYREQATESQAKWLPGWLKRLKPYKYG